MDWRAPVAQDASAVLELIVARDIADFGVPDYTLEDLLEEWQSSDIDLATGAVVIEYAGRLVGYALLRRGETLVVVGPHDEGRGLGARLLAWSQRAEREHGRDRHRQRVPSSNPRARDLLATAGYEHRRSYWRMVRVLDDPVDERPAPAGMRLRAVGVESDAGTLHELDALSFGETADYEAESPAQFRSEHLEAHDFDPSLSRVAEAGDATIGFLLTRRRDAESVGYVDVLGVHPAHRRRGLAAAMLSSAFGAYADAGLRAAQLDVASDNPRALALYERMRMTRGFRLDAYERLIDDRPPASGVRRGRLVG
jgi:mycothiol synthase